MCDKTKYTVMAAGQKAEQANSGGTLSGGGQPTQAVQESRDTAWFKAAIRRRLDYLSNEMSKAHEALEYVSSPEWIKEARIFETIRKAENNGD